MIRSTSMSPVSTSRKPRASGDDPLAHQTAVAAGGVNPARAGMILGGRRPERVGRSKPRASGDDPAEFGGVVPRLL